VGEGFRRALAFQKGFAVFFENCEPFNDLIITHFKKIFQFSYRKIFCFGGKSLSQKEKAPWGLIRLSRIPQGAI
jgi:hypothetical protein